MIRILLLLALLLAIALLAGCSEVPLIRAPQYLPSGAKITYRDGELAHLDADAVAVYEEGVTILARHFGGLPPLVQTFIVYHELCHHSGIIDEREADCCALGRMWLAGYLGDDGPAELALYYAASQPERAAWLLECAP